MLFQAFILLFLVAINAFFAASEIAIISLNDQKLRKTAEQGDKKAKLIYNLLREPSQFLATIQVGVTLSGLLASAVASESFSDALVDLLDGLGLPVSRSVLKLIAVIIITLSLSYFSLVLGELVPKRLAMKNPDAISRRTIQPLRVIYLLAKPFIKLLSLSTNLVLRLFGINPALEEERITEEEIRLMVDVGQQKGVIPSAEKEMIDNIFDFDNTAVSEVMTHRTEMVALPLDASRDQILQIVIQEQFSRIPVYQESLDNIVGILHTRDLIPLLKQPNTVEIRLAGLIKEPYYVPESKKNNDLLRELQKHRIHLAVVVDEYGGTAGIVSIEDLLEEIVGNIFDENDEEETEFEKVDEDTYLIDGTVAVEDVNKLLGINLPSTRFDTLSGYLVSKLGRIPRAGETPVIEAEKVVFKVEAVEERRITRVKACRR